MKRFYLRRDVDESGVSGKGRVAEGVVFTDGTCALRWLTEHRSTAIYESVETLVRIHGHGGKTVVVFEDCPGCNHRWKHHWMDNCGGCDVPGCQCTAMASLPIGTAGMNEAPEPECLCSPASSQAATPQPKENP